MRQFFVIPADSDQEVLKDRLSAQWRAWMTIPSVGRLIAGTFIEVDFAIVAIQ